MTLYPKLIMDALATVTYAGHYSERFGEWRPTEVLSQLLPLSGHGQFQYD